MPFFLKTLFQLNEYPITIKNFKEMPTSSIINTKKKKYTKNKKEKHYL